MTDDRCNKSGGFSARCELPAGHDGKHRQRTFEWDDDSNKKFGDYMGGTRLD